MLYGGWKLQPAKSSLGVSGFEALIAVTSGFVCSQCSGLHTILALKLQQYAVIMLPKVVGK